MAHEFRDDRLNDIRDRDILNLEIFLKKKIRRYRNFKSSAEAQEFQGRRLEMILVYLGINFQRGMSDPTYFDNIFKQKNIKVENRLYIPPEHPPEDEWRSGVYVYKDNEIAGFVGYPIYNEEKIEDGYTVMYTEKL
jgi:hypothetical protein